MIKPITHSERYRQLDALRGFALFGILLANLYSFMGYSTLLPSEIVDLPAADRTVLFIIDWFVEGKFYSIFSMLFGMGFALQSLRVSEKGDAFKIFWLRRMCVLLMFGLFHMLIVWNGDILTLYSLVGITLIFFVNFSNQALRSTALFLLFLPLLMHVVVTLTQDAAFWGMLSVKAQAWQNSLGYEGRTLLSMRASSDPKDVFLINIIKALGRPISYLQTGRPFQVLGMFVLGAYYIKNWLEHRQSNTENPIKNWRKLGVIGVVTSFAYAWIKAKTGTPYALDDLGMLQAVFYHICAPCFGLGIAGMFLHLWQKPQAQKFITYFVPLGRMALTNYILQNSLAVLLFFGYGFGLMRQIPFAYIPVFAVAILYCQWLFNQYWLTHFKQGPLELIWRKFTYRQLYKG